MKMGWLAGMEMNNTCKEVHVECMKSIGLIMKESVKMYLKSMS